MAQNQGLPAPAYPFVGSDGKINPVWYQFLSSLWQRTGGGTSEGSVQSVTVESTNGILSSVANPSTTATVNLSLGGISPTSINTPGSVIAASGDFSEGLNVRGNIQFGTFTLGAEPQTGYITITDSSGTPYKLLAGI